ncbi:NAD(P)-dependent alcohol dehydrogenase [Catenovulum sp. 2E275]|uniref:zinc-dependent alcohol dehydrogenase family protein n=1 Tax=Catenovulum sp. 2E275 TaxID=2980497 RepID=UPI0021D188B2|nr:NAD(P)-dependent alcohol dehydrogenase [Catenovulum sp. 2E275]MCU4677085.1 NAD(P)-dependent alcohol dehydrogenase [Catenovulum sp. 2E275]
MKQYQIKPRQDAIELVDFTPQTLAADEIRVELKAASINYRDLVTRQVTKQSVVPFSDGSGKVIEVGANVSDFKVGDKVIGLFFPDWMDGSLNAKLFSNSRGAGNCDGMLSQQITGNADGFIKFPEYLNYQQASTLPCAGVTAWHALFEIPQPTKKGQTVLIQGTGGVSVFAIQLAAAFGLNSIVISSSDEKLEQAKALGATHTINYVETPDWDQAALAITNGIGVDIVLEVGGAGTLEKSLNALKVNGVISLIGILTGIEGKINPFPILTKSLRVFGIYVASKAMQSRFHQALTEHQIIPVISKTFEFEQADDAYLYQKSAKHFGKIVITNNP